MVQRYFERYFQWYNTEHYHSLIGYVTPIQKHTGQAERIMQALGAFAYLAMDKGKTAFAAHMPNALLYLKEALQGVDRFPVLREMVERAEDTAKKRNP